MPRSSIFSFESQPRLRAPPWGLAFALCLLAIVELGLARREAVWSHIAFTDVGIVDALESQVLGPIEAEAGVSPRVLFFGNSRARDAFAPRQFESSLDLAEGEVLNLALTRGTAYDAETLYRRNRERLRHAELAFFGVDIIQLDGNIPPNERVRRYAPLGDRLTRFSGEERMELLAGWVWRSYDARDALRRWVKSFFKDPPREIPIAEDGRVEWRTKTMNRNAARRSMSSYARQHFAHYRRDASRRQQLQDFVELLESDGIEVVIVQVPVRERYAGLSRREYIEALGEYEDDVMWAVGDRPMLFWWDASFAGLRDVDFHDYGHVKDPGARKLTRRLATWTRERYGRGLELLAPAPEVDEADSK